jgi:F0F1-type ATP synthase epsilon subunit
MACLFFRAAVDANTCNVSTQNRMFTRDLSDDDALNENKDEKQKKDKNNKKEKNRNLP